MGSCRANNLVGETRGEALEATGVVGQADPHFFLVSVMVVVMRCSARSVPRYPENNKELTKLQ